QVREALRNAAQLRLAQDAEPRGGNDLELVLAAGIHQVVFAIAQEREVLVAGPLEERARIAGQSSTAARTSARTQRIPAPIAFRRSGSISRSISTWMSDSEGSSLLGAEYDCRCPSLSRRAAKIGWLSRCSV